MVRACCRSNHALMIRAFGYLFAASRSSAIASGVPSEGCISKVFAMTSSIASMDGILCRFQD